jgi:DNA polymerase III subunit epsilon
MQLTEAAFSSIDVETTGIDPRNDEIISFASVPMRGGKIQAGNSTYTLIKPAFYKITAMKYHGISDHDLESAPTFKEMADSILKALEGILIGHSVDFDYRLLVRFFKQRGIKLERETIDIAQVERWLCRKAGKMGMDLTFEAMMARYGFKESYRHNALADAFFVAQMFQNQLLRLSERGIDTVKGLKKAMKSYRYALW